MMPAALSTSRMQPHPSSLENLQRMEALGVGDDPVKQLYWELGRSRLRQGQVAQRFGARLDQQLTGLEHARALAAAQPPLIPTLDEATSLHLGNLLPSGQPYRLAHEALPKGILIGGSTGAGKTVLLAQLAQQLSQRVPLTITDGKDEAGRLARCLPHAVVLPLVQQRHNLLAARRDTRGYLRYLAEELGRALNLHRVTIQDLAKILWQLSRDPEDLPSFTDLIASLDALAKQQGRGTLRTAARALETLLPLMGDWARVRQGPDLFAAIPRVFILPRKDLPPSLEYFFHALLVKDRMDAISLRGHTTDLSEALLFDEARRFFGVEFEHSAGSGRFNVQTELVTKARSYGLCLVIASQSIARLQKSVVDNAATFIAMRTQSDAEAKYCAQRLGLPESRARELMELAPGEAWVVSPTLLRPVKIQVPYQDLGDYPAEHAVAEAMAPHWAAWDAQTIWAPPRATPESTLNYRELLGEAVDAAPEEDAASAHTPDIDDPDAAEETWKSCFPEAADEFVALLRACQAHPPTGVMALYQTLGWSAGRGHRVKQQLLANALITTERRRSPQGGRPREVIQLTPKGERFLQHHEFPTRS